MKATDDNGSGTVTILEAFRALLTNSTIALGGAAQTIEFHWYAGEEGGLLGSQAIFSSYSSSSRNVAAMYAPSRSYPVASIFTSLTPTDYC
jgi:bacterial leucyl aminopeptidase